MRYQDKNFRLQMVNAVSNLRVTDFMPYPFNKSPPTPTYASYFYTCPFLSYAFLVITGRGGKKQHGIPSP